MKDFQNKKRLFRKNEVYNLSLKSGFTLIELLVVIAIIGLLASIVLTTLEDARTKAQNSRKEEEVRQISTALELYRSKYNTYPPFQNGTSWYCIGYEDDSCFFGAGTDFSAGLNTAIQEFMPGMEANVDSVPFMTFDLRGIGYKCEDSSCDKYKLRYFLKDTTVCNLGIEKSNPGLTNTECEFDVLTK